MGWNVLEIIILLGIVFWQAKAFLATRKQIFRLALLFPEQLRREDHLMLTDHQGTVVEQLMVDDITSKDFQEIVDATNTYLRNNKGSADFTIIKSISERISESQETQIASTVTTPLYLGLMGTFAGVILGLVRIISKGGDQLTQSAVLGQAINGLLIGVGIAMIASFFGLALTTYNNVVLFKEAIQVRNANKNGYYNFLQSELLPGLDNNLFSALHLLKNNIGDFNQRFADNLKVFDQNFGSNISQLQQAVSAMSEQITDINENTRSQIDFLQELRQMDYQGMAKANIKVLDKLRDAGPMLTEFVREHQVLNTRIQDTSNFMDKIGALMNRVSAFEDNINGLGREIQQSEMLGGEVITLVRQHLAAINNKEALISDYASKSSSEVQQYLKVAGERVAELKRKIEIDFEHAFNFDAEGNLMQNLSFLKPMNDGIAQLHVDMDVLSANLSSITESVASSQKITGPTLPRPESIPIQPLSSNSVNFNDNDSFAKAGSSQSDNIKSKRKTTFWQRWFKKSVEV